MSKPTAYRESPRGLKEIKAIETVYKGYRFRSRLEARWAVFFDTLGVKWEYEKEGYSWDETRYLPDFWLSDHECWIEIKGQKPTKEEQKKAQLLAEGTLQNVHIFYGEIEIPDNKNWYTHIISYVWNWEPFIRAVNMSEAWYGWAQCPYCLQLGITYHSHASKLNCKCSHSIHEHLFHNYTQKSLLKLCPDLAAKEPVYKHEHCNNSWPAIQNWWKDKCIAFDYAGDSPLLVAAYTAARQARFEHGETPK